MNPVPYKHKGKVLPTWPLCLVHFNKVSMLAAGTENATDSETGAGGKLEHNLWYHGMFGHCMCETEL